MSGAIIAIDQDRPGPTTSAGSAGVARNDLWVGQVIRPRSTLVAASYAWTLLAKPPGSTATLSSATSQACSFVPDVAGSYRIQLTTNEGGPGNVQTLVAACTYDNAGVLLNSGRRIPAAGETLNENNWGGNTIGWAEALGGFFNAVTAIETATSPLLSGSAGDILVHNGTNFIRLAKGSNGQVLKVVSGSVLWGTDEGLPAKTCTLEQFGAIGDGVTSDDTPMTAAIAAMVAGTYKLLILGAKTYLLTSSYTVPAGCAIAGQGSSSILKTTSDIEVLVVGGENVALCNFKILGNATGTSQKGIRSGSAGVAASGFANVLIHAMVFDSLAIGGLEFNQNPFTPFQGPRVSDCVVKSCGTGYKFGTRGEYVVLSNCIAESCTIGADVGAGNVLYQGGSILYCTTGVKLTAGTNDSHGAFIGTQINHSITYSVDAGAITNGHTFSGCHLFDGEIRCVSSTGVQFIGCEIDADAYTHTGAAATRYDSCIYSMTYANTLSESGGSTTYWTNCRTLSGGHPTFIGNRQQIVDADSSASYIGTDRAYSVQNTTQRIYAGSDIYFGIGSSATVYIDSSSFRLVKPLMGIVNSVQLKGTSIDCSGGGTITLSSAQYACVYLDLINSPGAAFSVVGPDLIDTTFCVYNNTTKSATLKKSGGTGVVIAPGEKGWYRHNGTDYEARFAPKTLASPTITGSVTITSYTSTTTTSADSKVTIYDETTSGTTSNATQVAVYTSPTLTDEAVHSIDVLVGALTSDGTVGAVYKRHYAGRRHTGTWTQIAAVSDDKTEEDSAAWDLTLDVSSNQVRVLATGALATTIRWGVAIRIQTTVP